MILEVSQGTKKKTSCFLPFPSYLMTAFRRAQERIGLTSCGFTRFCVIKSGDFYNYAKGEKEGGDGEEHL
jgi:hypothetical protein